MRTGSKRIKADVGQDDRDVENKARLDDDDSISTPQYNQGLSEHHGKTYLEAAGRLMRRGYGQTKPVANKCSQLGRAQNRRVELMKQ